MLMSAKRQTGRPQHRRQTGMTPNSSGQPAAGRRSSGTGSRSCGTGVRSHDAASSIGCHAWVVVVFLIASQRSRLPDQDRQRQRKELHAPIAVKIMQFTRSAHTAAPAARLRASRRGRAQLRASRRFASYIRAHLLGQVIRPDARTLNWPVVPASWPSPCRSGCAACRRRADTGLGLFDPGCIIPAPRRRSVRPGAQVAQRLVVCPWLQRIALLIRKLP